MLRSKRHNHRRRNIQQENSRRVRARSLFVEPLEDRRLLAVIPVTMGAPDVLATDGSCSLREAVINSNDNAPTWTDCVAGDAFGGPDTITVPAGTYTTAIGGTGEDFAAAGDLDINDAFLGPVTIAGAGAGTTIIDGGGLDRVFHVHAGNTATFSGVTIQGGNASDGVFGPGAAQGGGILNNTGTVTIASSAITGNKAQGGPGLDGQGGGLFGDFGTWTVTDSTISANMAIGGNATPASNGGGGKGLGGGIFAGDIDSPTISNSTLSGNVATGGDGDGTGSGGDAKGGAIYLGAGNFGIGAATVTVSHLTVADNHAVGGPGGVSGSAGAGDVGGIHNAEFLVSGLVIIQSSIVATNTASTPDPDVSGSFTSLGHNLIGDAGSAIGFGAPGDQVGSSGSPIDPLLGPLQNNGGTTDTHALRFDSPAVDTADPIIFPATDQRGAARPVGVGPDIGAFELGFNDAPGNTVPGPQATTETTLLVIGGLAVSDADANQISGAELIVTLTVDDGSLTVVDAGLSSLVGNNTSTVVMTGSLAMLNATLANDVTYLSAVGFIGADTLTMTTNDQGNNGIDPGLTGDASSEEAIDTVSITVTALPDGSVTIVDCQCGDGSKALLVKGTSGDDKIDVKFGSMAGDFKVTIKTGSMAGSMDMGSFKFEGADAEISKVIVYGLDGNDKIKIHSKLGVSGWLFGGNGDDKLRGGKADDVIVGGDGDDKLDGKQGRDLLIGGHGADKIKGQNDEDILIAGPSSYDNNLTALCAIMAEWTSASSFTDRIGHLSGMLSGGLNGPFVLNADPGNGPVTVFSDGDKDKLNGGNAADWLIGDEDEDDINGNTAEDIFTQLELDWLMADPMP